MRDLINIGDYEDMKADKKQRHYVLKCLDIAKRTFDVVNYGLLSVWWDTVKIVPRAISPAQCAVLVACFDKHFEHTLDQQCQLLQTLHAVFVEHKIAFPFLELPALAQQLTDASPLHQACTALQALSKSPCSVTDCADAESQLADILQRFAFLTMYSMASIKKIGYRQMRNEDPRFLHRYVALGIDKKFSEDAEKINYTELGEQTPAVLLYRGDDYQNGINLFPFVIDYNALTFEQGAKVCFFSATDLSDGALEYRFVGDNSALRIEKTGILKPDTDLNELLMQPENLKILNLDCVVDSFRDARKEMVGGVVDFNEL
jgi:hypothetical protein